VTLKGEIVSISSPAPNRSVQHDTWLKGLWSRRILGIPTIIWAAVLAIAVLLVLAFRLPNPTEFQKSVCRFILAVSGGVMSTLLFGQITLKGRLQGFDVSAGGPIAVFILLQFVVDPLRVTAATPPVGHAPSEMAARPCTEEKELRSIHGRTHSAVHFINRSSQTVSIYWLDYAGARVPFSVLDPSQETTQPTYVTHPWLIADGSGNCIAIYLPQVETPVVTVGG
jgi:hypothetical protein